MSQLGAHFEQIAVSASAIGDLPFAEPKIFTNALLRPHDITVLIRDTEYHERALFQVPTVSPTPVAQDPAAKPSSAATNRRSTIFDLSGGPQAFDQFPGASATASAKPKVVIGNRRHTAVASLLGGDFAEALSRGTDKTNDRQHQRREKEGDVDVELLLKGAEKLCDIYPIPHAREKIAALRSRYQKLASSVAHYEGKVDRQTLQLHRLARRDHDDHTGFEEFSEDQAADNDVAEITEVTEEDIAAEEAEIAELERKKRQLEERVSGIEKDLGGLLR